jgi:hypothetical protein
MENENIITYITSNLITEGPNVPKIDILVKYDGSILILDTDYILEIGDKVYSYSKEYGIDYLIVK